jgi:hypothetical protein
MAKVVAGEAAPLTTRARLRRNVAHAAECARSKQCNSVIG